MHIFDVNQAVRLVVDDPQDIFHNSEGIIEDVTVDRLHDTIYGIRLTKKINRYLHDIADDVLVYFKGYELSLVE